MITWTPYPNSAGEWAEVNGLRLIAMHDGSWSVSDLSHKIPSITSPQVGPRVIREWNIDTAKEQAQGASRFMKKPEA